MILERGTESTNSANEHRLFVAPASRRRFPEQTVQRNNAGETPAPPNCGGSSPPCVRPSNGESLRGLWTESVAHGVLLTHRNKAPGLALRVRSGQEIRATAFLTLDSTSTHEIGCKYQGDSLALDLRQHFGEDL